MWERLSGHFKGASSSKACRNSPWASTSTNLPRIGWIGWIEDDCGEILKIPNFVFSAYEIYKIEKSFWIFPDGLFLKLGCSWIFIRIGPLGHSLGTKISGSTWLHTCEH